MPFKGLRFKIGASCLMVHRPSELGLCRRRPHLWFLPRSETGGGGDVERCSDSASGRPTATRTAEAVHWPQA